MEFMGPKSNHITLMRLSTCLPGVRNAEYDATAAGTEQRRVAAMNLGLAMGNWAKLMREQNAPLNERKYWP